MKKSKQILNEVELEDFIRGFVTKIKETDLYTIEYVGKLLAFVLSSLYIDI